MPRFSYQAITDTGASVNGVLEADTLDAAMSQLALQGYIPKRVKAAGKGDGVTAGSLELMLTTVKPTDLILFTKQFKTMFQAGVSVLSLLKVMAEQTPNKKLKHISLKMRDDINKGMSLYDAFSRHPKVFSPLYCSMIRAGEASGRLPDVLDKLIHLLQHEFKIKSDIKSAMQYPITVVVALVVAFLVLLTFVIPVFVDIFTSAGIEIPLPTRICLVMYEAMANYWYVGLVGLTLAGIALGVWFRSEPGKYMRDFTILKLPILGPVFLKAAMARFASIFAILQASGVSILEVLDILSMTIGNRAIAREFETLQHKLREGHGIAKPLREARYFPAMVVNMVAIGEESGNLEQMLDDVSQHYDDEVSYAVSRMSAALGPVLIVALAGVVGFFALAIFLPMWDLTQLAGR